VNRLRYCTIAGLALSLAACATPEPAPPTEEIVEQALPETTEIAEQYGATATWGETIEKGAARDGWLKTFGDPALEKIVAEALANNRDLAVARANLDAAAASARQAGAALAPAVNLGGGTQSTTREGGTSSLSGAGLNVSWEVDIWGKLAAGAQAAEESYRASEADMEAARQSLVAQTAKAWFQATETNLQLQLADKAIAIYEEKLGIVQAMADAGAGSPQDVNLAKADLAGAKERQRSATGAQAQAVRSIEVLLGRYPSAEVETASEFVPTPPGIPVGVPASLLERRPDLIAAERRVAAAFQRTDEARAARLPSFSLTASGGSPSTELADLLGGNFFSLGANFIAPLDVGGELEAQVEIQTAQQEAALAEYGSIALKAFSEVESGLTNEQLLLEREALLADAASNNEEAARLANAQFDAGTINFLDVLQLQTRALNSQIELVNIKNTRLAQRVDLHLALGGSFEAE
jgi:NodT family efflux transporter outer membrane factor (OMF) lipoprotein